MALELDSLKKAIGALERSLRVASEQSGGDADLVETLRAGVVQNFVVAYEQSWKMMKRWLEANVSPDDADGVTRRQLFRLCHENRLIDDVGEWMDFHRARNETSHTYNSETAENVFSVARVFLPAAADVFARIAARNDGSSVRPARACEAHSRGACSPVRSEGIWFAHSAGGEIMVRSGPGCCWA